MIKRLENSAKVPQAAALSLADPIHGLPCDTLIEYAERTGRHDIANWFRDYQDDYEEDPEWFEGKCDYFNIGP